MSEFMRPRLRKICGYAAALTVLAGCSQESASMQAPTTMGNVLDQVAFVPVPKVSEHIRHQFDPEFSNFVLLAGFLACNDSSLQITRTVDRKYIVKINGPLDPIYNVQFAAMARLQINQFAQITGKQTVDNWLPDYMNVEEYYKNNTEIACQNSFI